MLGYIPNMRLRPQTAVQTHVREYCYCCEAYEWDCYSAGSTTSGFIVGLEKPLDVGEVKGRGAVVCGAGIKSINSFSILDVRIHGHDWNLWFGLSHSFKKGCSRILSCPHKNQIRSGFPY
jgi:hypothetical protein